MTVDELIDRLRVFSKRSAAGGDATVIIRFIDRQSTVFDCYLDLETQVIALVPEGHVVETDAEPCPGCGGDGRWQTACCSGASGCSCKGDVVEMGTCNVCEGRGYVFDGKYDPKANIKAIEGRMYVGSGPTR